MQFDAAGGLFLKTMLFLANHTDQYQKNNQQNIKNGGELINVVHVRNRQTPKYVHNRTAPSLIILVLFCPPNTIF